MKFELDEQNLPSTVIELRRGLTALSLSDNLKGFLWEGDIDAGIELPIRNALRILQIPFGFLILRCSPVLTLVKGETPWSKEFVYLKNISTTSTISAQVFFMA